MRIGKIEKTDWNIKEIEKKIEENKMGRGVRHDHVEKVPKWSREQVRKFKKYLMFQSPDVFTIFLTIFMNIYVHICVDMYMFYLVFSSAN